MTAGGTETCTACGAACPALARTCPYCGAEQKPDAVPERADAIQRMVVALEDRLKRSKSGADGTIALLLLLIVGGLIGSWFLYGALGLGVVGKLLAVLATALGLVLAWGAWIGILEKRAIDRCYHTSIKPTIDDYLRTSSMSRHDFDALAAGLIAQDAFLRPYLFGGDRTPP